MNDVTKIGRILFGNSPTTISAISQDQEANEYSGYNFRANGSNFKFRKAKLTPKKNGQFVTLWKRNANKDTEPFHATDDFDFYIIVSEDAEKYGFFLFPKRELVKRNILSTDQKEGKRGFRVYPTWVLTENKQAEKTQQWQTRYFFECLNARVKQQNLLHEVLLQK